MLSSLLEILIENTAQGYALVIGGTTISFAMIGSVIAFVFNKILNNKNRALSRNHKDTLANIELCYLLIQLNGCTDENTIQKVKEQADEIMTDVEKRNLANPDLHTISKKTKELERLSAEQRVQKISELMSIFTAGSKTVDNIVEGVHEKSEI